MLERPGTFGAVAPRRARKGSVAGALGGIAIVGAVVWSATALPGSAASPEQSVIRTVDDEAGCGGAVPCYAKIQVAVDEARSGDQIRILPGRYRESVVVVDKALDFTGPGRSAAGEPLPAEQAIWESPFADRPHLLVDAFSQGISRTSVTGFHFVSVTRGLVVVGREPGGAAPAPGRPPAAIETTVESVVVADTEFTGGPGPGVAVAVELANVEAARLTDLTIAEASVLLSAVADAAVDSSDLVAAPASAIRAIRGAVAVTGTRISRAVGAAIAATDTERLAIYGTQILTSTVGVRVEETSAPGGATNVVGGAVELHNRFSGNGVALELHNSSAASSPSSPVDARYNDWGSAFLPVVEEMVVHSADDLRLGRVRLDPLVGAPVAVQLGDLPESVVASPFAFFDASVTVQDARGLPPAPDALVAFSASEALVSPDGGVAQAEGPSVERLPPGAWTIENDSAFGRPSGAGYLRATAPGAALVWRFTGAGLVRYAQTATAPAVFTAAVDREPPVEIVARGPDRAWVLRPLGSADGPVDAARTATLTLVAGTLAVDSFTSGRPLRAGLASAEIRSANLLGSGVITATAFGSSGSPSATGAVVMIPGPVTVLTVTTPATTVVAGGQLPLHVTANDAFGHAPADGAMVTLSASRGVVSPTVAIFDSGIAEAVFVAPPDPGEIILEAAMADASAERSVTVVPGPPAVAAVRPERVALTANSHDFTVVAVEVADDFGNPVLDGTAVAVSTTLGAVTPSVGPTSGGRFETILTAGKVAGEATVTASAGSVVSGAERVLFRPADLSLTKQVEPLSVVVPGERVTYSLAFANRGPGTVYGARITESLPAGLVEPIITAAGPSLTRLPGEELTWEAAELRAGASGVLTVVLRVDAARPWGQRETLVNRAELGVESAAEAVPDDNAGTADTVVVPGAAFTVTLSGPGALPVAGRAGTIRARLTDRFGNSAADDTAVFFSTDRGALSTDVARTVGGVATTTLTSDTRAGLATVRALTVDGRGGVARVRFLPGPADRITVVSDRSALRVGGETAILTTTLADAYGNLLVGTPVELATNLGRVIPLEAPMVAGGLTATLRSGVRTGVAEIVAAAAGLSDGLMIPFTPDTVAGLTLTVSPQQAVLGQRLRGVAASTDRYGNPVPGVPVAFDTTLGRVDPPLATTDARGQAQTFVDLDRTGGGTLRATAGELQAEQAFTVRSAAIYLPYATRPGRPLGSGAGATASTAANPVASAFAHTRPGEGRGAVVGPGEGRGAVVGRDQGQQRTLGGGVTRLARVAVAALGQSCSNSPSMIRSILRVCAPLQDLTVNVIVPRFVEAGGAGAEVVAQVIGSDGAPAPDGTRVTFTGSLGLEFEPGVAGTLDGSAVVRVIPGDESGFARVDASVAGAAGSALLWVRPAAGDTLARLTAHPQGVPPGGSSRIEALVLDPHGNPAEGDLVVWSAVGGEVEPQSSRVDNGRAETRFTAGETPMVARVSASVGGSITETLLTVDPIWGVRNRLLFLPRALAPGGERCGDVLVNGSFEADLNSDGLPDGWLLDEPVALTRVRAEGLGPGYALRFHSDRGVRAVLFQDLDIPDGAERGSLRLWLRSDVASALRVSVWSTVEIAGRPTRAPLIVSNLAAAPDWALHVLPLPIPPRGATTVQLSPRSDGAALIDVDRLALEVCRS